MTPDRSHRLWNWTNDGVEQYLADVDYVARRVWDRDFLDEKIDDNPVAQILFAMLLQQERREQEANYACNRHRSLRAKLAARRC